MLKKNNLICQGTCMSFKLQITILNSYYAYDIMTFSKQHIQVMLFLTIESIIKTKIIFQYIDLIHHRKKMSISFLKIDFFFWTSFVNGTFIPPAPLHNHRTRKGMFLGKVCGAYCPNYSLWNSDKEQLVDKEGPVSTKKYISK